MLLSDEADRRAAVFTEDHAFVWASAGTGKTHTLTLRALVLIWRFGGEGLFSRDRAVRTRSAREAVRKVVLTTFTRKAAAEMQTRLYRYLDLFVQAETLDQVLHDSLVCHDRLFAELAQSLLEFVPDRSFGTLRRAAEGLAEVASELQISTLHSLAATLLRRHPVETRLPVDCRFAQEDEDQPVELEERLLDRWWQTEALRSEAVQQWLDEVLREIPLEDVKRWFRLSFERPWIADATRRSAPPSEQEAAELLQALQVLSGSLRALSGARLKRTGEELETLLRSAAPENWTALCRFLIANETYLFHERVKTLERSIGELDDASRAFLESFDRTYGMVLGSALRLSSRRVWEAWQNLLDCFLRWSREAGVRELGVLSFDDMIRRCVRLLVEHPAVRRAERKRIGALLVDEFQDTDPLQLELLSLLLDNSDDPDHEVLGFFVGDDKQSIYRFRGADVDSVVGFCRHFPKRFRSRRPRREFHLQTSFRSDPGILDFVNGFFEDPLDLARGSALLQPFREAGGHQPEWMVLAGSGPGGVMNAVEARQAAAQAALQVIREHLRSGCQFRDILVLARDGWELNAVLPVLNRAGIPVVSLGTKTFFRHPEVLDTLNLLIALHHPQDSLAAAAVLRSPLVMLDDPTIDHLIREVGAAALFFGDGRLSEEIPLAPRRRIERLRSLAHLRRETDIADWLAEVRSFIPMFAYLDSSDFEGRALARIDRVLDAFRKECVDGAAAPPAWLWAQRQRADRADAWDAELGEDVALADETIDAVRVMTIHKAKGLEGRIVIVLDWGALLQACFNGRRGRSDRDCCLEQTDPDGRPVREMRLGWGALEFRTPDYLEAAQRERQLSLQEARRLAYVAATRARDRLVLLQPVRRETEALSAHLEAARQAGLVRVCQPEPAPIEPVQAPPAGADLDETAYRRIWESRLAETTLPGPRLLVTPTASELDLSRGDGEESERWRASRQGDADGEGLVIGALVHEYLERGIHLATFDYALLRSVAFETGLQDGMTVLETARAILERFFDGSLLDAAGQSLIERVRTGRIRGREVPVYLHEAGRRWHGVIDLVLEEQDGIVGVDYKTSRPADPMPDSYVRQQELYTAALERVVPDLPVRFEFWWLR